MDRWVNKSLCYVCHAIWEFILVTANFLPSTVYSTTYISIKQDLKFGINDTQPAINFFAKKKKRKEKAG
ncbi:hypothetical protein N431DRAFT_39581 [Stipitochalara longipes BDJ]|nr:hypothetical protein N431DRAFT_39581 [Stipitochalara longipes BDJ]